MDQKNKVNLNYFFSREALLLKKYADFRTRIFRPISRFFISLGITADMLSYFGLFILIGFVYFIKTKPMSAIFFLVVHILIDIFDGPLARESKTDSNSGALTDIFCDHTGMVVVTTTLIWAGLLNPILGIVYVYLYTLLIIFIIIRNVLEIPASFVFRSKYELYFIFLIYALFHFNFINYAIIIFILLMIPFLFPSFFIIKRKVK